MSEFQQEIEELRARLQEAEETIEAIRSGSVDALVVLGPSGEQVYALSSAEQPYRVLIEEIHDGAVVLAPDGTIHYCNRHFADLLKLPLESIMGAPMSEQVSPDDRPAFSQMLAEHGGRRELTFINSHGARVPSQVSAVSVTMEGMPYVCLAVTDLTERERAEREIRALNEDLEQRVMQRTELLEVANRNLEAEINERKVVEGALRESETRLKLAQEAGRIGVFDWDIPSGTTVWTKEQESIYGFAPHTFDGKIESWASSVHPNDLEMVSNRFRNCFDDRREELEVEYRIIWPEGEERWVSQRSAVTYDEAGKPVRMIGTTIDVTERKQAEQIQQERAAHLRAVFTASWDAFAIADDNGRYVEVNPAAERIFGVSSSRLVGRPIVEFMSPDIPFEQAWKQFLSEGTFCGEHRMVRADGSELDVARYGVARVLPGRHLAVIRDVTESKRTEKALAEANERKDEFLAMLAHELRNPLAPMRNAVQVLRMVGERTPMMERQQDIIDRQVTHMARLLNDLLDASRITRGKIDLKMQPLRIAAVVAHAVETATPLTEARHQVLTVAASEEDIWLEGDIDRLAQAVGNLLNNSAKYTPENGHIWLETAFEDNEVVIHVRDTGTGIPPDVLPRIFDLFAQGDQSLARSQGGLGIGLTLVRQIVTLHGGTVEARSAGKGQGAEFIVRLPAVLKRTEPDMLEIPGEPVAPVASRRVLVVDDMDVTAASLAQILELWGHCVSVACDGESALEAVRSFHPEVVLLDIGLPGMDGYEIAQRIRQEQGNDIVLIAQTGYSQDSDRERARAAGFNHHIVKPLDLKLLQTLLGKAGDD